MPGGYGSNAFLAICRQNSMGATAPTSWFPVPFANHTITRQADELLDDSITGAVDEPDRVIGFTRVGGNIVGNVDPLAVGFLLKGLFGTIASSAVGSGFQHVFSPRSGDFGDRHTLPPYALQVHQGESVNSAYLAIDNFFNTLQLEISPNAYLRGTWGIIGGQQTLLTKAVPPAWPSGVRKFPWSAVSLSIAGAGVARYRTLRFSFDNRVAAQDRINATRFPQSYLRDGFRVFGRFSGEMDIAQADWLNMLNETEQAVSVYVAGVTSISSGVNEFLRLDYARAKITEHPTNVPGPGLVTVTVNWKGEYSVTSAEACRITLQNTIASGVY